jgi:peptidase E
MTENYPDYLFEEAARREKENKVLEIAKNFMNEHSGAMEELAAIEAKELIDEALEELDAIVMGGQDTREFYNSVKFIKDVLNRLR